MKPISDNIWKIWFEIRIFISLSIVFIITSISFLSFKNTSSTIEILGKLFGLSSESSILYGYYFIAILISVASLIRMWAGSILTSGTVMAFKIQDKKFLFKGPYKFVRNPIYLADLIAFTSLSFCLKPIGLLIPVLIYIHYRQLINYEEKNLKVEFGKTYSGYLNTTPRIFPRNAQLKMLFISPLDFHINFDGFRHNAQYILFIPGLIVSAYTGKFIHAILIGLPAVIDWAVIHTIIGVSKVSTENKKLNTGNIKFTGSKVFNDILYSQCWEDPELDRMAFKTGAEDTIVTITSGGCNALAFLLDNPKKIICLDMNKYQNYLLSLKINAFKLLNYDEMLEFLGVTPSMNRWLYYERLRLQLPLDEQFYWNNKRRDINRGIIHCGRYERYMHLLKNIFRILIGRSIVYDLFNAPSVEERQRLFKRKWENTRWRVFCRIFLSRTFASMLFDKAFYNYLDPEFSFERYYMSAVKRAVTELPVRENYFLTYMLLGNFLDNNYPVYLRRDNFAVIRDRVDRIELVTSGCMNYFRTLPSNFISKFNFTNIFEWMSLDEYANLLKETIRISKPGAIITYRNHLITRKRPQSLSEQIIPEEKMSEELHRKDLSFIYKAYIVERIQKS